MEYQLPSFEMSAVESFGDDAIRHIEEGTNFVFDIMKSSLGPFGAFKLLKGKKNIITNDGATILKNLFVDSPSAKILIESSKTQDFVEGDGTTSIVILSALLLKRIYQRDVNHMSVIRGLSLASNKIVEILNERKFSTTNEIIKKCIKTTLNSKIFHQHLDQFVDICIRCFESLTASDDLDQVKFIRCEGDMEMSFLSDGLILENALQHNFDDRRENSDLISFTDPKIMLVNTHLDFDKIKISKGKIQVNSISELEEIENIEKKRMKEKIDSITKHKFDILINRQIVYDYPSELILKHGVSLMENVGFDNMDRLQISLHANVFSHFDSVRKDSVAEEIVPVENCEIKDEKDASVLSQESCNEEKADENIYLTYGTCEKVEVISIKGKNYTKFSGLKNSSRTIVLFGSSPDILDEAERSIHDALCVLKRLKQVPYALYGAGNTEMILSILLNKYADQIPTHLYEGSKILSDSLMEYVEILCHNFGHSFSDVRSAFVTAFNNTKDVDRKTFNLGVCKNTGNLTNVSETGVIECFSMKQNVVLSAIKTVQLILKCDGIIQHPPRKRDRI